VEALSIAIVLIFIMWLVDKHAAWKTVGKLALIALGIAALGLGSFYGWTTYQERKREAAERRKHAELVASCMRRGAIIGADADTNLRAACENDPDSTFKSPCWSKPNLDGMQFDLNSEADLNGNPIPPKPNQVCYPIQELPKHNDSMNSSYSSTLPNPPDDYAAEGAICWKDKGGNIHYPTVVVDGIDLTAGIIHSEEEQHHCSLLKAGETLLAGQRISRSSR